MERCRIEIARQKPDRVSISVAAQTALFYFRAFMILASYFFTSPFSSAQLSARLFAKQTILIQLLGLLVAELFFHGRFRRQRESVRGLLTKRNCENKKRKKEGRKKSRCDPFVAILKL